MRLLKMIVSNYLRQDLDKFWTYQDVKYDYETEQNGTVERCANLKEIELPIVQ